MRCEDALNQLNARADGELRAEDAAWLDAHLAECLQCRAVAEGLPAMDAELRRAFSGRREAAAGLAENVSAIVRESSRATASLSPAVAPAHQVAWAQVLMGLAAGFLRAIALFRPWQAQPVGPASLPPLQPVARLAVASGPVEVQPASQLQSFTCPEAGPIEGDSIVRTGPTARCEIALDDGNALRLDCNTEVKLHKNEVVEIKRGRLACPSIRSGGKGLEVESGGGKIVARPAAQFAVDCRPPGARLIVVDGPVSVHTAEKSVEVEPGKQVRIVDGKLEEPKWCDPSLETAWVNSVLALRSSQHPELVERVNQLLANVGAAKLSLLYEDELRRLGDDGVPPLLAYLASTRETPNVAQRATAARIVADVGGARWIADLIELLTDANADVRFHAARGLERLTGRNQGCDARTWQTQSWGTCEGAHQKWLNWWAENHDRYPATRRDIPAPKSPPF
jgi:ferric-dicitrate binding protein FerR (iron transport regulator)